MWKDSAKYLLSPHQFFDPFMLLAQAPPILFHPYPDGPLPDSTSRLSMSAWVCSRRPPTSNASASPGSSIWRRRAQLSRRIRHAPFDGATG